MTERVTAAIATAATASPWWLPGLHDVSAVAAVLLPIVGVLWLALQIAHKIVTWRRATKD